MKNNGGFIPGIRPGRSTSEFIEKSLNKITMAGAVFIGLVALFPMVVAAIFGLGSFGIGGTSILIVVGVVLETQKQIESQMMIRHYKGFLE
ncbi:MAG: preprotein translocase subunit SecY, partial [Clostridia bacterium]|nr:preprotein translocase subunit SecY [Clostridia bacterium]